MRQQICRSADAGNADGRATPMLARAGWPQIDASGDVRVKLGHAIINPPEKPSLYNSTRFPFASKDDWQASQRAAG
jgi:hypothetical protein